MRAIEKAADAMDEQMAVDETTRGKFFLNTALSVVIHLHPRHPRSSAAVSDSDVPGTRRRECVQDFYKIRIGADVGGFKENLRTPPVEHGVDALRT